MEYPLNQIYFYLTEGCNLCCRHCWIDPKYQTKEYQYASLDFGLFKSIIEQARPLGLSGVKLTGGEPLMHPEIYKIIELVRDENLRLTIETNGILCTYELAKKIKGCKTPFVAVSLDGVNAETHEWVRGVDGCFEKAIEGIKNLVRVGLKPQIIMALMCRNKDQVEPIVRLAESLGCGSIKFNIVQPIARGERLHEENEALSIEELVSLGKWVENTFFTKTCLPLYYSHPPAFRPLGKIFGDKANGCRVCGILGILGVLSSGFYALCGIGETVTELVFGDARTDSLENIWNNTPILRQLRKGLPGHLEGICSDCAMKSRCLGNCIAQNYYRSKNLWAGFWYCEAAYNRGIFPESKLFPRKSN